MGFLEHFAQSAGAGLCGKGFFFKIEVVVFGLAVMMAGRSLELLFFQDFFLNVALAGSVGGNRGRFGGGGFVLLLAAQAKQAEAVGGQGINIMGGGGIGFGQCLRGFILG